jgi:hypothetical protein
MVRNFLASAVDLSARATKNTLIASPPKPETAAVLAILYFERDYIQVLYCHQWDIYLMQVTLQVVVAAVRCGIAFHYRLIRRRFHSYGLLYQSVEELASTF